MNCGSAANKKCWSFKTRTFASIFWWVTSRKVLISSFLSQFFRCGDQLAGIYQVITCGMISMRRKQQIKLLQPPPGPMLSAWSPGHSFLITKKNTISSFGLLVYLTGASFSHFPPQILLFFLLLSLGQIYFTKVQPTKSIATHRVMSWFTISCNCSPKPSKINRGRMGS